MARHSQLASDTKVDILANCALKCFDLGLEKQGVDILNNMIADLPADTNPKKVVNLYLMLLQRNESTGSHRSLEVIQKLCDCLLKNPELQGNNNLSFCFNIE